VNGESCLTCGCDEALVVTNEQPAAGLLIAPDDRFSLLVRQQLRARSLRLFAGYA
jgi:hypothetical protein